MIELHQYPAVWGLSSLSPFCIKVEAFLRRAKLPYRVVVEKNPARGPKGKMPFIRDGETTVADSSFILQHLFRTRNLGALEPLDPVVRAQGHAFQRLIEENLYFVLLYSRWLDPSGWNFIREDFSPLFPPMLGKPILRVIRSQLRRQAQEQGLGRHSIQEVYDIGAKDLAAIAAFLADKPFLLGESWAPVDATLYAFLVTILRQPFESELKTLLRGYPNLVAYCEREHQALFPELPV